MTLPELVESYINGNLSDCRKSARNRSTFALIDAFVEWGGMSLSKATATARYLKTGQGYQAACDAD